MERPRSDSSDVATQSDVTALRAALDERTHERDAANRERDAALERIRALESQFDWLKRQVFGETSERLVEADASLQSTLFTDLPDAHEDDPVLVPEPVAEPTSPGRRKRRPPGTGESGLRADATVPREIIELTLPEFMGEGAGDYEIVEYRVTERLARRRGQHFIVEYRRPVVKHRASGRLKTAPAPAGLFDRSLADVSFVAGLIIDKCQWHLPLHRQHQRLEAAGIHLSRTTLSQLVRRSADLLEPIAAAQLEHVLTGRVLALDETTMKAGRAGPGKMKRGYYWVAYGQDDEAAFTFSPSRGGRVVEALLGDFRGTLLTDGYQVYDDFARGRAGFTHAQCWAHTRRKFEEAKTADPDAAAEALTLIGGLYHQETWIRESGLHGHEKIDKRQEYVGPYVAHFWDWVDKQLRRADLEPKSRLTRALKYALDRRGPLEVFLTDPAVQIDTNHLERVLRPVPMGRKNHLFCWTETGARELGVLHSLVATCRLQEVDPYTYLVDVMQRVDRHPARAVRELTPRLWKERFATDPLRPDWDCDPSARGPATL